jgi:spore coat protein U-like protein
MQLKTTLLAAAVVAAGLAVQPFQAAHAGSVNANMNVKIQIQNACEITTAPADLDFGTAGPLTSNVDNQTTFGVTCTDQAPYNIGLDNGQNASGGVRRMADGNGNFVSYALYQDNGRTTAWGDTVGTDTEAGTGSGDEQTITVYGRVAPQTTPPAGSYQDTVVVAVTY